MNNLDIGELLEVIKDAQFEMNEPEVSPLISSGLDRKVEWAIEELEKYIEQSKNTA